MKRLILIFFALFGFSIPSSALADEEGKTEHLLKNCLSDDPMRRDIFCGGYITGFTQGVQVATAVTPNKKVCLPDVFSGTDGRDAFIRFMSNHKDRKFLDDDPQVNLWMAFTTAYPCKKSK